MKIYICTVIVTLFLFILNTVIAVDRSKFRTCADTRYIYKSKHSSLYSVHYSYIHSITCYCRFCRIQRKNEINPQISRHYKLIDNSLHAHQKDYRATIISPTSEELNLYISAQASGFIRVKITEKVHRWQV